MVRLGKKLTPETLIKRDIRRYLGLRGWFCFPIVQTIGSMPGVPDIIACKSGQVLFLECKAPKGKQNPAQMEFQRMIELSGCRYLLVRSIDDITKVGI